jgi:bacillithiol system protein YtxJ
MHASCRLSRVLTRAFAIARRHAIAGAHVAIDGGTALRAAQRLAPALTRLLHSIEMHPKLTPVHHLDELERLLADSGDRPLLLFKHSFTCGVSAEALDELVNHLNGEADEARYAMVTVQTHRDVSNAVAARLGIRHETPQAILIRDGRAIWSASHFRVNAAEIQKALGRVSN